jgi:phosphoglycolate phosphatase-like HAD superfamily hydrolase
VNERRDRTCGCAAAGTERAFGEVVLDWNGTVVADRPRAIEATNLVLAAHGLAPISDAEFGRLFALPLQRFLGRLRVPAEALRDAEAAWNAGSTERVAELSRGALELLVACQDTGVPVGILTAADPDVVAADAERLGVRSLLTWVIGPCEDKASELRERIAQVGRVAYVGDTADDVSFGRSAGAFAVGFTGGYHDAEQLHGASPDLVVDDLAQLVRLLLALSFHAEPPEGAWGAPERQRHHWPSPRLGGGIQHRRDAAPLTPGCAFAILYRPSRRPRRQLAGIRPRPTVTYARPWPDVPAGLLPSCNPGPT